MWHQKGVLHNTSLELIYIYKEIINKSKMLSNMYGWKKYVWRDFLKQHKSMYWDKQTETDGGLCSMQQSSPQLVPTLWVTVWPESFPGQTDTKCVHM